MRSVSNERRVCQTPRAVGEAEMFASVGQFGWTRAVVSDLCENVSNGRKGE